MVDEDKRDYEVVINDLNQKDYDTDDYVDNSFNNKHEVKTELNSQEINAEEKPQISDTEVLMEVKTELKNLTQDDNLNNIIEDFGVFNMTDEKENIIHLIMFFKKKHITEKIIRYFSMRNIIFLEDNKIKFRTYLNDKVDYFDLNSNEFLIEKTKSDKSILIQGLDKKDVYLFNSLIEAMSFMSILELKLEEYKNYTILILNNSYKILDYYAKKLSEVETVIIMGEFWNSDLLEQISSHKSKFKVERRYSIGECINQDLKIVAKNIG